MAHSFPTRRRRASRTSDWRPILLGGALAGLIVFNMVPRQIPTTAPQRIAGPDAPISRAAPAGLRVVDGDTFDYLGQRIRIADIDTPELRSRCAEEGILARRATSRLRELLAAGPFELSRVGRDEDRYGRKLRIVTRNGRSIGDMLVAEGLARTWTGRREPWC